MHTVSSGTHAQNRKHNTHQPATPSRQPPVQHTPTCTGTRTKPRRAIKARRVHQPSRHRNRHRHPHRTPAATTDAARAPQTTPLDKAPRRQRARSTRWTTHNYAATPQTAHPTVHPLTSRHQIQIRVSVNVLCALHDCALGSSPVTSYPGVKSIQF